MQLIRFLSVTFSRINKTLVSCPCNTQTMRMTGSALPDGKTSTHKTAKEILRHEIYIYIYAFSRRFYPKRLTSAFKLYICISMCVLWESNPQPFVLLMQCSTTEPHRNTYMTPDHKTSHKGQFFVIKIYTLSDAE